jgi:hypothetical protein
MQMFLAPSHLLISIHIRIFMPTSFYSCCIPFIARQPIDIQVIYSFSPKRPFLLSLPYGITANAATQAFTKALATANSTHEIVASAYI